MSHSPLGGKRPQTASPARPRQLPPIATSPHARPKSASPARPVESSWVAPSPGRRVGKDARPQSAKDVRHGADSRPQSAFARLRQEQLARDAADDASEITVDQERALSDAENPIDEPLLAWVAKALGDEVQLRHLSQLSDGVALSRILMTMYRSPTSPLATLHAVVAQWGRQARADRIHNMAAVLSFLQTKLPFSAFRIPAPALTLESVGSFELVRHLTTLTLLTALLHERMGTFYQDMCAHLGSLACKSLQRALRRYANAELALLLEDPTTRALDASFHGGVVPLPAIAATPEVNVRVAIAAAARKSARSYDDAGVLHLIVMNAKRMLARSSAAPSGRCHCVVSSRQPEGGRAPLGGVAQWQTRAVLNDAIPTWQEQFDIPVRDSDGVVGIDVFLVDAGASALLGHASLKLSDLMRFTDKQHERWYKLVRSEDESATCDTTLRLRTWFTPTPEYAERTQARPMDLLTPEIRSLPGYRFDTPHGLIPSLVLQGQVAKWTGDAAPRRLMRDLGDDLLRAASRFRLTNRFAFKCAMLLCERACAELCGAIIGCELDRLRYLDDADLRFPGLAAENRGALFFTAVCDDQTCLFHVDVVEVSSPLLLAQIGHSSLYAVRGALARSPTFAEFARAVRICLVVDGTVPPLGLAPPIPAHVTCQFCPDVVDVDGNATALPAMGLLEMHVLFTDRLARRPTERDTVLDKWIYFLRYNSDFTDLTRWPRALGDIYACQVVKALQLLSTESPFRVSYAATETPP